MLVRCELRFVATAVAISTLLLTCVFAPPRPWTTVQLLSPPFRPRRIKPSPETDAFSMRSSSAR